MAWMGERSGVELRRAYGRCSRLQLRHDPTFFWATSRLPREVRPAVRALYGYVRVADDLVDGARRHPDPSARRAALDAWEAALGDARRAGGSDHPVIAALVDAGDRHDLALDELGAYMRSMRIDCGPVRIGDADELDRYMDGSAGAVGRILAPLLGCEDRDAMGDVGVAFQLTNFLRDVREDWRMDRIYVPGLPEDELRADRMGPQARSRVAAEAGRARALLARAGRVPEHCDAVVRDGMRIALGVYGAVLDRIEHLGFDVLAGRTTPGPWQVVRGALARPRAR